MCPIVVLSAQSLTVPTTEIPIWRPFFSVGLAWGLNRGHPPFRRGRGTVPNFPGRPCSNNGGPRVWTLRAVLTATTDAPHAVLGGPKTISILTRGP